MPDRVENWDLATYPLREKNGDIQTSFFKLECRKYDGNMDFKTWKYKGPDDEGKFVEVDIPYAPKTAGVTRVPKDRPPKVNENDPEWYGMISRISNEDLIRTEREILGGKPTSVMAGLWFELVDGGWVADDRNKIKRPRFWVDVTERYYQWREEAYKGLNDPFKNQKRPYTRIQEMEAKIKELEKGLPKVGA